MVTFSPLTPKLTCMSQWSGRCLGITGWDPSVCKSNWLHVDILRVSFIKVGYILWIPLECTVIFLRSWTSTGYFSNSTGSFVTNCRFFPIIAPHKEGVPSPKAPFHFRYDRAIYIGCWELGSWDLPLHTRVPSPKPQFNLLEGYVCNLSRWGHGSLDLPLHTQ